ncbi:penicillin acylase family protein [Saccharopolyspora shandongensis]|uniref:penicillin acylase family protein n=1 Tax=Saccharopolyspora shandongensis TaxID=418495 RepID=UPI0033D7F1AA
MTPCPVHRLRYRRLWRLPSVRTIGTTALVTVAAVAVSAVVAPLWVPLVVLAVGAAVVIAEVRRHRARIAIELRLVRALVRSGGGCPGDVEVPGLGAEVRMEAMPNGVTRIEGASFLDAVRALGFAMGSDRAFHLDLLRRTAKGRLSEVWGRTALPVDERYRPLGLARAAEAATASLEAPERDVLAAFAAGVNASLRHHGSPFEARFLSYRPEPWTAADSVLIALFLFHSLSWNEQPKRAEAVIRRVFPDDVADFFLPGAEREPSIPEGLGHLRAAEPVPDVVALDGAVPGSNCWVRGGPDARHPMLACDLHLPLTMPNLLYEVDLRWPGQRVRGLAAPGLPVVLTGRNEHVAWGVTNLSADVLDLVPADGDGSATPTTGTERIRVRGRADAQLDVTCVGTMPVSGNPLLGEKIAIRWTGHDLRSCDLKFQRLAQASSVAESIELLEQAQGIALNVLVADDSGRMAHLATGLLPRRPADRRGAADGYLTGEQRPRLVDPPSGILVSANDAALTERTFQIGYDLDPGHRARRLRRLLAEAADPDPAAMRAMQHDTAAELYLPYRDLAVSALAGRGDRVADLLASWDGRADVASQAFGVLVRLREIIAQQVLGAYLAVCREHDPDFRYPFRAVDGPLLAILRAEDPSLLPPGEEAGGWAGFVARCVDRAVAELGGAAGDGRLPTWGELNSVGLDHPLAGLAPWAAPLLGVAARPQSGALHSVRTCVPGFAAVGRAVLSPGAGGFAEFELPGGQSGHPLRAQFDDRHREWSSTGSRAAPAPRGGCAFVLRPAGSPSSAEPVDVGGRDE